MLYHSLSTIVASSFSAAGLPATNISISRSGRPDLGQFQIQPAIELSKVLKLPPRAIAEKVLPHLASVDLLLNVRVDGPGFINFSVADNFLAAEVTKAATDERQGTPLRTGQEIETVVIDYGGPNVAKAMHVGHLRSAIIGDTLRRIGTFLGDNVIGDIHLGDWGLPMGMVIAEICRRFPDLSYFGEASDSSQPEDRRFSLAELTRFYAAAAARCQSDTAALEEARLVTAALQDGEPRFRKLWQGIVAQSVAAARREFERLNVHFDVWLGESDVHDTLEVLIEDLKARHIAELDQGALIIPVASDDGHDKMPPLIVEKADGAETYAATDLATIAYRIERFDPDVILYVVDQRQQLHFNQVFRAAEKIGLIANGRPRCEHIGFGTINGPDGKPLRTRSGDALQLSELIAQATAAASKRLVELGTLGSASSEENARISYQLGIATIRFADLSNNRTSDYIFNIERFSKAEGRTGPYICYAVVRANAILRKAETEDLNKIRLSDLGSDVERELVLGLLEFPEKLIKSYDKRQPNIICEHLFVVAQTFNMLYHRTQILTEPDPARRISLLGLTRCVASQLRLGLSLLGIESPDHM